ncbi:transglutaminase family protein [Albimonas sp. CAU 1670]|uniref:transglutaminase family protein n=1 Tax=Albimonas sp. CAU 1670 TaxID=3032599 RepID=UPI0023DBCC09|nr:transglutaminase family protein [Albimonas sp. CAU 1670]MDF2235308.1 transglutaminase family protein [Albimonas sp. CAU 1670]
MIRLSILHRTLYRYRGPVALSPHRLLLRPRESRNLRLLSHEVTTDPPGRIVWARDVAGNAVATAAFERTTDRLEIVSRSEVELHAVAWPIFDIAAEAIVFPFAISDDDRTDLGALPFPQHPDPDGRLGRWAWGFVLGARTDTLSLLKDLCAGVAGALVYRSREEEGARPPLDTLDRGEGSCRDFAVLFAEAARALGFGARLVSGYLHDREGTGLTGSAGAGSTHAWAEIYLPGAGWVAFDPTNRSVGGADLIPVAVARDIAQATPVSGRFAGPEGAAGTLEVEVQVTAVPA